MWRISSLTFHPLLTADSPNLHQESLGELVRRVDMFSLELTQCEASILRKVIGMSPCNEVIIFVG